MKNHTYFLLILLFSLFVYSQNLKSENGFKISSVEPDNDIDTVIVLKQDATMAKWQVSSPITTYAVGDFAQGGIVFWLDKTCRHGLVCAKSDQSSGVRWFAGTYMPTRATGDGIYAGAANTAIAINSKVDIGDDGSNYAAQICNDLQITEGATTYDDWYLPSKYELGLMYEDKATIDVTALENGGAGFASDWYWSSTEVAYYFAWSQGFGLGFQYDDFQSGIKDVRAVRAF